MAKAALARIKLDDDREINLHAKVKVLLLDDDRRFLAKAKQYLEEQLECEVDAVSDAEEAIRRLQQKSYHIVITDLIFEPPHLVQGAQFITENIHRMGEAKVVAITGQALYAFTTKPELMRLGVEVIDKGQDTFLEELSNITTNKVEEQRQEVIKLLQSALSEIVPEVGVEVKTKGRVNLALAPAKPAAAEAGPRPGEAAAVARRQPSEAVIHLCLELQSTLTGWLRALPDTDETMIQVGEHELSVSELIEHIEAGTEVGVTHMDALVEQFKQLLGLENNEQ